MSDPWIHEDDEANATPEVGATEATAATEVQKPDVFTDPAIPTLVLPKPRIEATASAPETKPDPAENPDEFPNDYGECLKLAKSMQGAARLGDKATRNQIAEHRKYLRLQAHISAIQQGQPVIAVNSAHPGAFIGIHSLGLSDTKLRYLARTNRDIKNLLAERDALKAENAKLVKNINELKARFLR